MPVYSATTPQADYRYQIDFPTASHAKFNIYHKSAPAVQIGSLYLNQDVQLEIIAMPNGTAFDITFSKNGAPVLDLNQNNFIFPETTAATLKDALEAHLFASLPATF